MTGHKIIIICTSSFFYNIDGIITVYCSSRVQPASDELPSAATQSMTTTEASSDDVLMASNQVEVGPIRGGRGWELEVHRKRTPHPHCIPFMFNDTQPK